MCTYYYTPGSSKSILCDCSVSPQKGPLMNKRFFVQSIFFRVVFRPWRFQCWISDFTYSLTLLPLVWRTTLKHFVLSIVYIYFSSSFGHIAKRGQQYHLFAKACSFRRWDTRIFCSGVHSFGGLNRPPLQNTINHLLWPNLYCFSLFSLLTCIFNYPVVAFVSRL